MKTTHLRSYLTVALLAAGALTWIACGIVLSLRPAGHPPQSFRHTVDIMPFIGSGLLMVAVGIATLLSTYWQKANGLLSTGIKILLSGAVSYAAGSMIRFYSIPGKWEPLMPLGFLGSITGLFICGLVLKRRKLAVPFLAYLMILAAITLLFFNDQYMPWIAILFGLQMLIISFMAAQKNMLTLQLKSL